MQIPSLTSGSGVALPAIGFGTFRLGGRAGVNTIIDAIGHGYRLVDSAVNYENEGAVGRAARTAGVPRDELIVTSKLPGRHHHFDEALTAIEESVFRTGLDVIDLYMIHWPNPSAGLYVEAWTALIEAQRRGLVRQIGVCNFLPEHLERLQNETGVVPLVNQIELHPYFPQVAALAYHRERGILTEAWSPLGRGNDLLSNPVITTIATRHETSPAQVVLAWHVAVGAIPLPKASSPSRQRDNIDIFTLVLSASEISDITALGRPDGRTAGQDPAHYEEF